MREDHERAELTVLLERAPHRRERRTITQTQRRQTLAELRDSPWRVSLRCSRMHAISLSGPPEIEPHA